MVTKLASWCALYVTNSLVDPKFIEGNPSALHINAEFLTTDSDVVVWYDEHDLKPAFKIWCLDDPKANNPAGEINGAAVAPTPSKHTIDEIFNVNKRHVTESFDRDVTELKRRRTTDIAPYSGIVERTTRFHVLREFVPEPMKRLAQKVSPQMLHEILKSVRTLEQEHRYTLLDRLFQRNIYNLPPLREFEELERTMLVDQAGKMEGILSSNLWRTLRSQSAVCLNHRGTHLILRLDLILVAMY
jgi:hypothetical protein